MRNTKHYCRLVAALVSALLCPAVLPADSYPSKRVELVVAGGAGGGLDLVGRALEQALRDTKTVAQPIVIVNMAGGAGNTAKTYIQRHRGDPYYLYLDTNRVYLNKLAGTIPVGDEAVTPVVRVMTEYLVWVVRADSPFKTAKDLLAKLKADPTSVTFAISSIPSNDQINIVAPAIASGVDAKRMRIVPFSSALNTQLLGGHVGALSTPISEIAPLVRSGQVRALSVSSPERLGGEWANVPTWRSMGIDLAVLHWRGLFAPPDMPADALKFWEDGMARLSKSEPWRKVMETHGWYDAYAPSATFRKDMEREIALYTKIMAELGLLKEPAKP
jgi:putative tricarboxylic transport membrane protein